MTNFENQCHIHRPQHKDKQRLKSLEFGNLTESPKFSHREQGENLSDS